MNAGKPMVAALAPMLILAGWVFAAQPNNSIQRLSENLDKVIPPGTEITRVASGLKWIEGPVWIPAGKYLLFAEITINSIGKWQPNRDISIFLHPSGFQGTASSFHGPEPGSNGMTLDPAGRLTVAGHAQRDVYRVESMNPHAQITILADSYHGKRLNSPNDLVYSKNGSLYFTDPPYGLQTQSDNDPLKQLPFNGVYLFPNASEIKPGSAPDNSELKLLIKDLPRPNGIAFSPGEKYLYVDSSAPKKVWMRYPVKPDGTLGKGTVFYNATADHASGAPDGMKVDQNGNIFSAGPGGLWIFSPDGTHLGTIHVEGTVSNCAWGGKDWKTLYITAAPHIYSIRVNVPGIHP
ncbi:MAG TPA: SMP-30/gluconolactonase/LRE family protein [Bryobacteraceae bacterium]